MCGQGQPRVNVLKIDFIQIWIVDAQLAYLYLAVKIETPDWGAPYFQGRHRVVVGIPVVRAS